MRNRESGDTKGTNHHLQMRCHLNVTPLDALQTFTIVRADVCQEFEHRCDSDFTQTE